MYSQVKSCVKIGIGRQIFFFRCIFGVRQGENLSTLMFFIFFNDMSEFISHAYQGLDVLKDGTSQMLSDDDIEVYLKLYLLLYMQMTL